MRKPKRKIKNTTLTMHLQRIGTKGGCVTRQRHGADHYKKAANVRWANHRRKVLEDPLNDNEEKN